MPPLGRTHRCAQFHNEILSVGTGSVSAGAISAHRSLPKERPMTQALAAIQRARHRAGHRQPGHPVRRRRAAGSLSTSKSSFPLNRCCAILSGGAGVSVPLSLELRRRWPGTPGPWSRRRSPSSPCPFSPRATAATWKARPRSRGLPAPLFHPGGLLPGSAAAGLIAGPPGERRKRTAPAG